jgi:hypothetical protein
VILDKNNSINMGPMWKAPGATAVSKNVTNTNIGAFSMVNITSNFQTWMIT